MARIKTLECLSIEEYEELTEEEIDEYCRPMKSNSYKSLLPLFVYLILENAKRPLKQKEILELLEKSPYELKVERKALSRTLHNLMANCPVCYVCMNEEGYYLD